MITSGHWTIRRSWTTKRRRTMAKSTYEMAKENYPEHWNKEMLKRLVSKGRLTREQYEEITGEEYEP